MTFSKWLDTLIEEKEFDLETTLLVKIDFVNGDCLDYFRHLAQALAI